MDIAFVLNHTSSLKSQAFELGLTSSHNMLSLDLLLREGTIQATVLGHSSGWGGGEGVTSTLTIHQPVDTTQTTAITSKHGNK
jgi:hypothetical protein